MQSFVDLDKTFRSQPRALGAVLARIDTGRGRERLFEDQRPELLGRFAEHARIASITASNAIEGVVVDSDRAERIAEGSHRYRNRNEREFAGYRDAIDMLMRLDAYEELSVPFVLHLNRLLFEYADGNGGHLKSDQNLIVSYESGRKDVVFTPSPPEETEFALSELLVRYGEAKAEGRTHPLILVGALVLDFLAIHPVADGNGRLARLITTYELLAQGYGVTRYASLELRIFESKNTCYKALYDSQRNWRQGEHDIWPWVTYLARVLASAYDDFEQEVAAAREQSGNKQEQVRAYILDEAPTRFRRRDVERALPRISLATIRLVLAELRDAGQIRAESSGAGAHWIRV